jgi:hypothetical protein
MMFTSFKKQSGSIMPVTALALASIVGISGMVFDSSHLFVNKTKLQNMLDASALSSAKVLDDTKSQFLARQAANKSIANNLAQPSYKELRDLGLDPTDFVIQFSDTRNPFVANPAARNFVRIRLNRDAIEIDTIFLKVLGVEELDISGSALAGPSPALGEVCNLVPSIVCGDPAEPPDNEGMYGYEYGDQVNLAMGSIFNNDIGPGNFQLLDLGMSGKDDKLRENLAGGSSSCASSEGSVETKPGVNRGPVAQGFNVRFGIYSGGISGVDYPPDFVTDAGAPNYPDTYAEYQMDYLTKNYDEPVWGRNERRVMAVAFGNCDGTVNGQGTVELLGFGCVFLNAPAENNNALKSVQISGELIRDCRASGVPGPNPVDGPGVHTIQLYGDPDRWDS